MAAAAMAVAARAAVAMAVVERGAAVRAEVVQEVAASVVVVKAPVWQAMVAEEAKALAKEVLDLARVGMMAGKWVEASLVVEAMALVGWEAVAVEVMALVNRAMATRVPVLAKKAALAVVNTAAVRQGEEVVMEVVAVKLVMAIEVVAVGNAVLRMVRLVGRWGSVATVAVARVLVEVV